MWAMIGSDLPFTMNGSSSSEMNIVRVSCTTDATATTSRSPALPSIRAAVFTGSPISVYVFRCSLPRNPANTLPVWMP